MAYCLPATFFAESESSSSHPMNNSKPASWRILVVADDVSIHNEFERILNSNPRGRGPAAARFQYQIDVAFSGHVAIEKFESAIKKGQPHAAAFIDFALPDCNGIETSRRFWRKDADLPIAICTERDALATGRFDDEIQGLEQLLILQKPLVALELIQLAAMQVSRWHMNRTTHRNMKLLESIIAERTREVASTRDVVFSSLAKLAESRDPETGAHLERIQLYTRLLLERLAHHGPYQAELRQQSIEVIARSSILHDIGKVGIPDHVLLKPGPLTQDEFEIMKTHTTIGADAIDAAASESRDCDFLQSAAEIARCHHEWFDGTGYPAGRHGQNIPLSARIVTVADVFDALTSERVYKSAMSPRKARSIIESKRGSHFDPAIVDAFIACWPDFESYALENQRQCEPAKIMHAAPAFHILRTANSAGVTVN